MALVKNVPYSSPSKQKAASAKQRKGATVSNKSQQVADQPTFSQPEQPLTSSTGFDQTHADFTARIEQVEVDESHLQPTSFYCILLPCPSWAGRGTGLAGLFQVL